MYRYLINQAQLNSLCHYVDQQEYTAEQLEAHRIIQSLPLIRGGYNTTEIQPKKNEWPITVTAGTISGGQFPTHEHLISDLKLALMKVLEDWWPLVYDRTCLDTVKSQAGWIRDLIARKPYHLKDLTSFGSEPRVELTAALVKQLREKTGEGLMACKRALVSSNCDMKKAEDYLRNMGNISSARGLHADAAAYLAGVEANEFHHWPIPAGELVVMCAGQGKAYTGDSIFEEFSPWILCSECLPADLTPVLIKHNGVVKVGELVWDAGSVEECYKAYHYWDCPYNDGQDWDWDDVTHWMPLP